MQTDLYTLKDVATLLDVAPHRIVYLITSRQIAEPALRVNNVRVWIRSEIKTIAEKLNINIGKTAGKEKENE